MWLGSKVKCDLCSHEWIAVFHESSEKLECPSCKNMAYFEVIETKESVFALRDKRKKEIENTLRNAVIENLSIPEIDIDNYLESKMSSEEINYWVEKGKREIKIILQNREYALMMKSIEIITI